MGRFRETYLTKNEVRPDGNDDLEKPNPWEKISIEDPPSVSIRDDDFWDPPIPCIWEKIFEIEYAPGPADPKSNGNYIIINGKVYTTRK